MERPDWLVDPALILEMPPADFAQALLAELVRVEKSGTKLNAFNFCLPFGRHDPSQIEGTVQKAIMETWSVLEHEGFLAPLPFAQANWYFVTRRGYAAANSANFDSFRVANQLPKHLLHPRLLNRVWAAYVRGEYDGAVFTAFKEVEISVRDAAGLPTDLVGVKLVRKAFGEGGALLDPEEDAAEQESLAHLFAGAMGYYKNPGSHRNVEVGPQESIEMLMLASHLLVIVDFRASIRSLRAEYPPGPVDNQAKT